MSADAGSRTELVAIMALSIALTAMSIDSMLPAIGTVAADLGALGENDRQLILTLFFGGLTAGQLFYGPLSDAVGRKRAMYLGFVILAVGHLVCLLARDFGTMLVGRSIAGFGASGPRIIATAVVRDRYEGRAMAQVMSLIMAVFILVPIVAPALGQAVLLAASWRAIFAGLLAMTLIAFAWFAIRQEETLPSSARTPWSLGALARSTRTVLASRITTTYAVAAGLVFGAMIAFLGTAQQIFGEQYGLGARFPIVFAALASALGAASAVNARLVVRYGMRLLSGRALVVSISVSVAFFGLAWLHGGHPPLFALVAYLLVVFFCNGLMFGNFNALAMAPMGAIAGVAAAVVGTVTSLLSVVLGTPIGRAYDGTVLPLVGGLASLTVLARIVIAVGERGVRTTEATAPRS